VDDGSVDDTREVVASFSGVRYFYLSGTGVSSARNFGVSQSKYDLLAFLDDDDAWHPHKLKKEVDFLMATDLSIVHTNEIWFRNNMRINQKKIHQKMGGDIFIPSLRLCLISPSAVMLTKSLFWEMNGFDESFPVCEDYDLWLRITSLYQVGFIEQALTYKYSGHAQLSKSVGMDYYRIKSMANLLRIRDLDDEHRHAVKMEILRKSRILLNGHIRHNNMENFLEIFKIRQELLRPNGQNF
jgi:glycosyltransferase involved in cell wall biosynthesis